MKCVNKSHRDFKKLAKHYDVSINQLELITHKYWIEKGDDTSFPTSVYIEAQVGKLPYHESSKDVREFWDRHYSKTKEYSTKEGWKKAYNEAKKYFPEYAITTYENNKGNFVLSVRKPVADISLDITEYAEKLALGSQEYDDFKMISNNIAEETKKNFNATTAKKLREAITKQKQQKEIDYVSKKTGEEIENLQMAIETKKKAHPFTFNDGTTVQAPFLVNQQQENALNAMNDFIHSDETSMTLSGYAGTGKTSLMEMLAKKMNKEHRRIVFSATTNKAAAVLKERVSKSGFDAYTLNKVFGIAVQVDSNAEYNTKNKVNVLTDSQLINPGDVVVIDEASMINTENYNTLNSIAKQNRLKIIYVGDKAQLAPVNETEVSKVFRNTEGRVVELTQVERTEDNAILKEATAIRNGQELSKESSFNERGEGVAYVSQNNKDEIKKIVNHFVPGLKQDSNYFRILAYTNDAVARYNAAVRNVLGYSGTVPQVGEPMIGYANWGYDRYTKTYKFINSESYKVTKVGSPQNVQFRDGDLTVKLEMIPITLEDGMGNIGTFNYIDIKGNAENRRIATMLAQEKSKLWREARHLTGKAKGKVLERINNIEQFLFVNDNITEGNRVLQDKVIDFGYALTVHKSQGSTFTNVLLDDVDIQKADNAKRFGELNLGLSEEAFHDAVDAEQTGEMQELFSLEGEGEVAQMPASNTQASQDTNTADIKRQLEYVGVSRATDTVTIISNDIKKEDSPLNHIKKAPMSKASSFENKPVEQMSSTEVWRYLSAMQPLTKRAQVEYTPKGQARQTYTVENGHIYNSKGTEVYPGKTIHKNMVLANYAVKEGLAVVVEHPTTGEKYVVDNNQQITSVRTGNIMQWGEENGDRRRILAQAEKKFRERITATKERGNTLNEQLLDQLQLIGLDIHDETEMAQYLKEHGYKAIQEAIAEQKEIAEIKAKAIADGTFMKAPNSKPTNLTERQWLQVRTKAFKEWFGDWLSFNKNNPYSDSIHIGEFENDFSNADASGIGKVIPIYLGDKWIGESGFDNSLNDPSPYLDMPSVGGSNITIEEEYRGKGYGKAAYFEIAKLAANNGKVLRSAPDKSRTPASTRVWKSLERDGYAKKVEDRYEFINSSLNDASKVVDENGEPLVVYHASRSINAINSFKKHEIANNREISKEKIDEARSIKNSIEWAENLLTQYIKDPIISLLINKSNGTYVGETKYTFKMDAYSEMTPTQVEKLKNKFGSDKFIDENVTGEGLYSKQALAFYDKESGEYAEQAFKISKIGQDLLKAFDFLNDKTNLLEKVNRVLRRAEVYNNKNISTLNLGIWFSPRKEYTERLIGTNEALAVFLNIKNLQEPDVDLNSEEASIYFAKHPKVDGITGYDSGTYGDLSFAVKEPNQIKSATDNNGMFSPENDNIQMFIGKKARTQFEQQLMKARPDLATPHYDVEGTDFIKDPFSNEYISSRLDAVTAKKLQEQGIIKEGTFAKWALTEKGKEKSQVTHPEIDAVLDFLHSLEDNKENTVYIKTAIRWIANRSLTLPQDHTKAYQAFELARKKHLDLQKYNTLGELITAPEMQPKRRGKKDFDPDKATTFSNKRTVTTEGGRVFTVYDVENTEEGQREVCKALAAHYEMSPWCLSTFTATGEPTQSAKNYWDLYKALPRKIAYENGKPVAFNSDKYGKGVAETLFRGTPIITSGEESIIDSTERGKLARGTIDAWKQEGLVVESKILPNALRLTEKAKKEIYNTTGEAWWDMEDTHAQDSLSDSIVSEYKTPEQQEQAIEAARNEALQEQYEEYLRTGFPEPVNPNQEEISDLPFFMTPEGEIRGFATPEGSLYFDRTVMSPEHPIHEYTHLWDRVVAKNNPELWHRGITLMKQISLWKDIENDENYGKKWKALKGMTPEKLESLIASEVHSRLVGVNGEQILDRLSKEKGAKGIVGKLKQWLLDFWKDLKATFSNWSQEDLDKLTLQDFTMMTIRDFADGFNPNTFQQASQQNTQQATQQSAQQENPELENYISDIVKKPDGSIEFTLSTVYGPQYYKFVGKTLYFKGSSYGMLKNGGVEHKDFIVQEIHKEDVYNYINKKISETSLNTQQPAQEKNTKVNLAGYEYFKDLYEDTLVDADWKIPMLQELDKQLSNGNTAEENQKIIDKMDDILMATSEEELHPNTTKEEEKEVETKLNDYDRLNMQIDNLNNSDFITASEVRHAAELIMNAISDEVTRMQKEEGFAEKIFPSLKIDKNFNFQTATRKEIIQAAGIPRLLDRAKELFNTEKVDFDDLSIEQEADVIYENFDGVLHFGTDVFAMNEGFGIKRNYRTNSYEVADSMEMNLDEQGNYQDTTTVEEEEDVQEHWQIEQRTLDILSSATELVRMAIHNCYQIDKDGNKMMSKWGIPERVNPREAVKSIVRWTRGAQSLPMMVSMLKEKEAANPWLTQLINRLSDTSGNETDLQSQFYGVMKKSRQSYNITQLENGKYIVNFVNNDKSRKEIFNNIVAKYTMKEHPLFEKGVNIELLGRKGYTLRDANFSLRKAAADLDRIMERLKHNEPFSSELVKEAVNNIEGACKILGFIPPEGVIETALTEETLSDMSRALGYIVKSLDDELQYQQNYPKEVEKNPYRPFEYKARNSIEGSLKSFLKPIAEVMDDTATNVVFEDGKMYQEEVTPSYLTLLMEKFHLGEKDFRKFIRKEYGTSQWFKMKGSGPETGWRFGWLSRLANDANARNIFDHTVELNFNKHRYMKNMTPAEYAISMIAHYFTSDREGTAWFRVPMQSNKPSSEFIRFEAFKQANYKDSIIREMYNLFLQELSRIQTVNMRNRRKGDADFIKNWDEKGRKFNFMPYLNAYLKDSKEIGTLLKNKAQDKELAKLIQKRENLESLTAEEETKLITLVQKAVRNYMDEKANSILDMWEKTGILEATKGIQGIGTEDAEVRDNLENFIWNDNYAAINILQLTVGDIAAYKDADDLQKRLAELHAPGIRANIYATDYGDPEHGIPAKRVSDGKYRTIILKDFDTFKSNIIANIAEIFDRKIAVAPESQKKGLMILKESLVGENGKYTKINVTDAQGYSSPSSYRKKALMFGKWSRHSEEIYKKLLDGEYDYSDLETAFQPLKPFVYSQLHKEVGVQGEKESPIQTMNIPFQAKNAEYLLIMADAMIKGEVAKSGELSRPNLLRAVYRVMEESERLNPTMGIDTVQFESAIKSGLQGKMDISQFMEIPGGEEAAYTFMMNQIYQRDENGIRTNQYNTRTFIHETSYDSYCLQQEVPAHFDNHNQSQGSQERMIIPSDLDLYKDPNGNLEDEANKVYYEWVDPDGTHRKEDARTFRREYEETIADNINISLQELARKFKLDTADKRIRNIALSEILQKEILDNPRYGIELFQACSVDKKTGEFRIPKGDPIQAKRIEQLINSIIKTMVNKQEIAGGPIVQVSNFGTSKQLRIRFNAHSGGILKAEDEFTPTEKYKTYEEYKKAEQAGIAYFEVFAPMWMKKKLFKEFADKDGNIDIEAIETVDPELLKMISYRIPTEDKYSIAPMKIEGFMPKEAGDAIMLPYELTEIDDSDFDVDKRYVMRKELEIKKNRISDVKYALTRKLEDSWKKAHPGQKVNRRWIREQVEMMLDNPQRMKTADRLMSSLWKEYVKQAYYTEAPDNQRAVNNNKILDMTWGVLTHEMTADKILNPGGFDNFKGIGYKIAAYKNGEISWGELQGKSIDDLKDLSTSGKDLTWVDTQVHYYQQNAAGSNLIGVFAVNKVAHATLESDGLQIAVNEICGEIPFTIAGKTFGGLMEIDPKYDDNGNLIGKTIGSGVSASADTAKEPVLDLMNINMTTAGTFNTMLRLGMPMEDAALFLSQNVIKEVLDEFNRQNLTGYASLDSIIANRLKQASEKNSYEEDSNINTEAISREELIRGLKPGDEVVDYKVLLAFQKLKNLANVMRNPTFATRFNSISSAVGPQIVDNLVLEYKMEQFTNSAEGEGTHIYTRDGEPADIYTIFGMHPILSAFSEGVTVAKTMFRDMPTGSTAFRELLNTFSAELKNKLMTDKKLLSKLSDFYQSYLLINSGLVNPNQLKRYIENFPKWFVEQKIQEKYPGNKLIQDITMTTSRKTGRTFMNINTTGLKETDKETYRSAWTDLHKTDPELSKRLFTYWFFRGGIGFTPKTAIGLVPNFVKENLEDNGISYLDVFRQLSSINPEVVIDQFIRNNWENSKLVPKKGGKNTHYSYDKVNTRGILEVYDPEDKANLAGVTWMRTKYNKQTYLWKLIGENAKGNLEFKRIMPLGDNAEYLEMSTSNIINPMSETTLDIEDWTATDKVPTSPAEDDAAMSTPQAPVSDTEKAKGVSQMAEILYNFWEGNQTIEHAQRIVDNIKNASNQKMYSNLLIGAMQKQGITVNKDNVLDKFNEFC